MKKMKIYITPKNAAIIKIKPHTFKKNDIEFNTKNVRATKEERVYFTNDHCGLFCTCSFYFCSVYPYYTKRKKFEKLFQKI